MNKGPADLLRKPARPRPGTAVVEPDPEPQEAVEEILENTAAVPDAVEPTEAGAIETEASQAPEPEAT